MARRPTKPKQVSTISSTKKVQTADLKVKKKLEIKSD